MAAIPCLRYDDAPRAIQWLCDVFGFEEQLVVPEENGKIAHAQLKLGRGMIMLGSTNDSEYGQLIKQPRELENYETQSPYLVVEDADAVYEKAKGAGAIIESEIRDEDYGGRGFGCRDFEGHFWYVGTYDPWKSES